jgi:hypothetical protein
MSKWGSPVEIERKRRINLALWAYAYQYADTSLVSDSVYDEESRKVDIAIDTGNAVLDKFFREEFNPDTGMWVSKHPEFDKVAALYKMAKP